MVSPATTRSASSSIHSIPVRRSRPSNAFTKEAAAETGLRVEVIKRDHRGAALMTLETIQGNNAR